MSSTLPIYHSIALDIAQRIINGDFPVGTKISGRSLLAGQYNVSPETIRKAISLLKDSAVVNVSQGKEVLVTSVDKAYHFIEHHKSMHSVYSLKQDLEILLLQKQELDNRFEEVLTQIIRYSDRLKNLTPYNPVEVTIPEDSHVIGRNIAEIKLWQHTGATIVAIRRGTEIIISPGPMAVINPLDKLVIVGNEDIVQETIRFINKKITLN